MPDSLKQLLGLTRIKHIPKGQIILYEGDSSSEAYLIKNGLVKLYDIDDQGNEKTLHLLKAPAMLPFAFFSGEHTPTQWYYTALVDCDLYVLSKEALWKAMEADGTLTRYLINWFSSEVHELLVRLGSLSKSNVRDKLTATLTYLAVCHGVRRRSGWVRVSFPVSHQLLADIMGVTRESTAMAMKEFADEKLVRNPRLTILEIDFDKLIA